MQNQQEYMPVVTTILAIAATVFPILFGFLLWKLSQIFVTNRQFDDFKSQVEDKQSEISRRLETIDERLLTLLQRTAERGRDR